MPTKEEFLKSKPRFNVLVNSKFGDGKTYHGLTYPKVFYAGNEPQGLELLRTKEGQPLLSNLVEYEFLTPESNEDLKDLFDESDGFKGRLYKTIRHAKDLYKEGKVDTLFFDNFTFFAENRWAYQNTFKKVFSEKKGTIDTQSMYQDLGVYLDKFTTMWLLTFPGNLVVSCHLKRESEDTIEGNEKTKNRARAVDLDSDISPAVRGGFRFMIEGKFRASIYLERKMESGNPKFIAYCQRTKVFGTTVAAKNNYGLPVKVENCTYKSLMENCSVGKSEVKP